MNEPSNDVYDVPLTIEEAFFLLNALPPMPSFPQQWDTFTLSKMPGQNIAGGPELRLKIIALYRHMQRTKPEPTVELPLELTVGELWLLDTMFSNTDLSQHKMYQGTPLVKLAMKVWDVLLDAYAYDVDMRYLPASGLKIQPLTDEQQAYLQRLDQSLKGAEE